MPPFKIIVQQTSKFKHTFKETRQTHLKMQYMPIVLSLTQGPEQQTIEISLIIRRGMVWRGRMLGFHLKSMMLHQGWQKKLFFWGLFPGLYQIYGLFISGILPDIQFNLRISGRISGWPNNRISAQKNCLKPITVLTNIQGRHDKSGPKEFLSHTLKNKIQIFL